MLLTSVTSLPLTENIDQTERVNFQTCANLFSKKKVEKNNETKITSGTWFYDRDLRCVRHTRLCVRI
jgi:hypothetical protein